MSIHILLHAQLSEDPAWEKPLERKIGPFDDEQAAKAWLEKNGFKLKKGYPNWWQNPSKHVFISGEGNIKRNNDKIFSARIVPNEDINPDWVSFN